MLIEQTILLQETPYCKEATIYYDDSITTKGVILYIHGGGLLYGNRNDLPALHITEFTSHGYQLIALDYPLAPAADIAMILQDLFSSAAYFCSEDLPYYIFGRSAGAYLSLLLAHQISLQLSSSGQKTDCSQPAPLNLPSGIISYYGYGFLCDEWFHSPSPYYEKLPAVDESCVSTTDIETTGNLTTHYSAYVHARQTGQWISTFYNGEEKNFLTSYSLRKVDCLPCPLFCAHSTNDPDVPYEEFRALRDKYQATPYVASANTHDFDRNDQSFMTKLLLRDTITFLDRCL